MSTTSLVPEPIGSLLDDNILDDLQLDLAPRLGADLSSVNHSARNARKLSLEFSDKSLLRGVGVTKVLRRFGKLFNHSVGTAEDYQLGQEVREVSAFITHNWSLSRWKKYMALCCYFHIVPAFVVSLVVHLLLFGLVVADKLPQYPAYYGDRPYYVGCWCMVGGWSAFWLTLFLWADVAAMFGRSGPIVFVDKVCIDQVELDRKVQGILAIPAWLACSDTLVAVFSEELLVKLWTCFELCTFVALGRTDKIRVEPALLSSASFLLSMCCAVIFMWQTLLKIGDGSVKELTSALGSEFIMVFDILSFLGISLLTFATLTHWGRVCNRIRKQVHELDIRTAACQEEADRAVVLRALQSLSNKHISDGTVSEDQQLDELAMAEFTVKMRSQLENAFVRSLGRNRLPFKYLVASIMPLLGDMLDYLAADLRMQQLMAQEGGPPSIADTLQQVAASIVFRVSLALLGVSLFSLCAFIPVILLPSCPHSWSLCLHFIGFLLSAYAAVSSFTQVEYMSQQEVIPFWRYVILAGADIIAVIWLCFLYRPMGRESRISHAGSVTAVENPHEPAEESQMLAPTRCIAELI
ncbi:unnamed protein product [Polarella glacialis]|uniref:Uncharacterized protein n=1 Tax=Polarella glacialis TaxID=89957 RepID=A0A813HE12_POLGL|nr:unnamed protein product [Polarella glacialis]CAE8645097.1 unnamed protein product [Polarella glacialis]